jgi:hypothetical protein
MPVRRYYCGIRNCDGDAATCVACSLQENTMMLWVLLNNATPEALGFIPSFVSDDDPRPAREQLDTAYGHGGGWRAFPGFTMLPDGNLKYPGDPPTVALAETYLRDETIRFYQHSWVAVIQPDGTFEVCRMD